MKRIIVTGTRNIVKARKVLLFLDALTKRYWKDEKIVLRCSEDYGANLQASVFFYEKNLPREIVKGAPSVARNKKLLELPVDRIFVFGHRDNWVEDKLLEDAKEKNIPISFIPVD